MLRTLSLGTLRGRLKGFTLIELLVVIGIIAILAAIVLIAVNPARQFAQSRNTQRESDIRTILDGIHEFAADNNGNLPGEGGVPGTALTAVPTDVGTGGLNYAGILVPTYISAMPTDPTSGTDAATGYLASKDAASSRVTVAATGAELSATISVTR